MTPELINLGLHGLEIVVTLAAGYMMMQMKVMMLETRRDIQASLEAMSDKHEQAIADLKNDQVKQDGEITEKVMTQLAAAGRDYMNGLSALEHRINGSYVPRQEIEARFVAAVSECREATGKLETRINTIGDRR